MWVEFVVGSLLCSERFFSGFSGFPLSSKTNTSKFQFDLDVRHFSHEPLARVIAQALPVLDVKFHLHLHLHFMDQVKAYVTLTTELISGSNVAPGGKYPLQDLNSTARATRLVRKLSLKFLELQCLFSQDTIQDEPSTELAETFSNKVTSA